jgi:hypothetical protein
MKGLIKERVGFRVFRVLQPEEEFAANRRQAICTVEQQRWRCWHGFPHEHLQPAVQYVGKSPSPYTFAPFVEHWHGAATRVGPSDTAFPHRQYAWNFFAWSNWTDPAETDKNIRWTRECWEGLRPYLVSGAYGNYVTDEGEAIAREAYGCNYDRLVALTIKYDPTNFFRMNHNIKPDQAIPAKATR